MKPYLAGPINGCTDDEAIVWRERVKACFPLAIDPMVRDYRGAEIENMGEIVVLDKRDIRQCDVMLVNYTKPSVGTAMEILYAWEREIPVIVWMDIVTTVISPWLAYHATCIVSTFTEAMDKLEEFEA